MAGRTGGGSSGASGGRAVGGTSFGGTGASGGVSGVGGSFAGSIGCFAAGTRIATPSGTTAIEQLALGDLVLAYDEITGRVVERPVTATFVHTDHPVGALPLSNGRVLRVTANHPIYLPDQHRYTDAGELAGDDRLLALTASTQTSSLIAGAFDASAVGAVTVYNITVAGEHNYFAEGVLVHNKSGAGGTGPCDPVTYSALCVPARECIDPHRPSPEYIGLNQSAEPDAGPDAGVESGARTSTDAGVEFYDNAATPVCFGGSVPPNPTYLAFDIRYPRNATPAVAIYTGNTPCEGSHVGEAWLVQDPPPANVWTTQCVRVAQVYYNHLTLVGANGGTEVRNPRFASGCACPRRLVRRTTCGPIGNENGGCEPHY